MAAQGVLIALFVIRLAFPVALLASAISLLAIKPVSKSSNSPITAVVVSVTTPRRAVILSLLSLIALSYFLDGLALVLHSILTKTWQGTPPQTWWASQWSGLEVEVLGGLLASGLLAIIGLFKETKGVAVWTHRTPKLWTVAAFFGTVAEVVLLFLTVQFRTKPEVGIPERPARTNYTALLHVIFPLLRLLVLVPLFAALASPRVKYVPASEVRQADEAPVEGSSLLAQPTPRQLEGQGLTVPAEANGAYGTFNSRRSLAPTETRTTTPAPSEIQPLNAVKNSKAAVKSDEPSWGEMYTRIMRLTPYLWPKKSVSLQLLALLCMCLVVVGRAVNVAIPLTLGALVNYFERLYSGGPSPSPHPTSFWPYLLAYVGLRFLQGSGGLNAVRDALWAPVMQYSDREMSQMSFNHLLSLSLSFHLRRKTGEILRILDRGSSINRVFELILFNIVPTFADIIVALVVFVVKFDWQLAFVVAFVMAGYITASVVLTSWRTRLRRQMNDKDIVTRGIHTDCLLNYETVKYFGGEAFENERYANAIRDYQSFEYRVVLSLNLLNLVQNLLMSVGFLVGGMIVAFRVVNKLSTPSDFVVFVMFLTQLYVPLNMLGTVYRSINTSLVDTERLLKLLDEPTDVNDKPGAPDLVVNDGEIEFDNVSFSYDDRTTALNGVSFKVPKGSSVALVGESGSGKSTILRLLYRFYDLKEGQGRILIDGKDVRDVTQLSIRKSIGVVPQDSVLFNASIAYNIGYGKLGASQEEIESAAKAAQMHERILSFPDGYETKVGERGVRLSGGEKQRVAIARTLLKNPPILLLDEATSALDTSTEKDIQNALQNLVQGRSSLSIAHRLSTIASADVILVLKDGQIVERGSHRELLERNGVFAAMWADQIRAETPQLASIDSKPEVEGYSLEPTASKEVAPEANSEDFVPVTETEGAGEEQAAEQKDETVSAKQAPSSAEGKAPSTRGSFAAVAASEPAEDSAVVKESTEGATTSEAPVTFPTAPVSFPTSEEPEEYAGGDNLREAATSPPPAGVTFDDSVRGSRSATPDMADSKRKRKTSQNLQQFARRVSQVGRRMGSVPIVQQLPAKDTKKKGESNEPEDNDAADGGKNTPGADGESPAGSVQEGKKRQKLMKRLSLGRPSA